jgi:hypothetical protein
MCRVARARADMAPRYLVSEAGRRTGSGNFRRLKGAYRPSQAGGPMLKEYGKDRRRTLRTRDVCERPGIRETLGY